MKRICKRFICGLLLLAMLLPLTGCGEPMEGPTLNGRGLGEYTIVYSEEGPSYNQRAAEYIQAQILERTGIEIPVCTAQSGKNKREILVGQTDRKLSEKLDHKTENMEFATLADKKHIAIEGDYFLIAAAAYFFVETYITGSDFASVIPQELSVHTPITEKANHYIFLIGDGMGFAHTQLFTAFETQGIYQLNDGEDRFYGTYFPYQGQIRTSPLTGSVTDSAASATALATGYQTTNRRVGRDIQGNDLMSLTELANSLGMATAVMSTDTRAGATPAGFTAHADDRDDTNVILSSQNVIRDAGTLIQCDLNDDRDVRRPIRDTLEKLDQSEKGFFLMYEEGHIDKHSHNHDLNNTFSAVVRFNQAIGTFMEYAFYNPDTFVLITADHENGGLQVPEGGTPFYIVEGHTDADVPVFAYGEGAQEFQNYDKQNVAIPRYIATPWGVEDFGAQ